MSLILFLNVRHIQTHDVEVERQISNHLRYFNQIYLLLFLTQSFLIPRYC